MLTATIMLRCIDHLLANEEEESLECLCKLLTTIGKDLESTGTKDNPKLGAVSCNESLHNDCKLNVLALVVYTFIQCLS